MFGATLDTAIGLAVVFLLFSILLTILMEIISGVLKLRAKALENLIARLIEDPTVQQTGWAWMTGGQFGLAKAASQGAKGVVSVAGGANPAAAVAPPHITYADVFDPPWSAG
jgi:hypothetical protein